MVTHRKPARPALLVGAVLMLVVTAGGCSAKTPVQSGVNAAAPATLAPRAPSDQPQERDVVTTGDITITVADVGHAADRLAELAAGAGGRVDDRTEHTSSRSPRTADLTLRIPAPKVDEFITDSKTLGDVTTISLRHEDVTANRVDLDARIGALQASVDRLLALMKTAGSTSDLLQAEEALSERQASLDGLRAQRTQLGEQISYATITVSLSSESAPSSPGFVASVRHGWHALMSFMHNAITLIGFLLPWSPLLLAAGWGLVVLRRRRRARRRARYLNPPM